MAGIGTGDFSFVVYASVFDTYFDVYSFIFGTGHFSIVQGLVCRYFNLSCSGACLLLFYR